MATRTMMMPEESRFKIDEATRLRAEKISDEAGELITRAIELRPVPELTEEVKYIAQSISEPMMDDITKSLLRAAEDFSLYSQVGGAPALRNSQPSITFSIRSVVSDLRALQVNVKEEMRTVSDLDTAMSHWVHSNGIRSIVPIDAARNGFVHHLADFLGNRIAGFRHWKGNDNDADKGLFGVEVSCVNRGYRILASPAYYVDWVYFGSPSSPVTKKIPPGRYIFGTDSIDGTVIPDGAIFQIPTDYKPELRRF